MTIKECISADLRSAMVVHNVSQVSALRFINAVIEREEINRRNPTNKMYGKELTDDDMIVLIKKEKSEHEDTLKFAIKGDRKNIIDQETAVIQYIDQYIPKEMTRDEIKNVINKIIADGHPFFRDVMPIASTMLRGKANGKMVAEVVKELTNG